MTPLHRLSVLALALVGTLAATGLQAASRSWSYTYTASGQIETADGPRTDVQDITRYTYDAQGHLTTVTNALGHVTQLSSFDSYGNPQTVIDPNGVTTTLGYTPQGWLASVSVGGGTTAFEHDAIGQITRVTRADGSWLAYTWDDARRLTKITNNLGEQVEFDLDAMGNRTAQRIKDATNSLTQQQQWVYDELGRLLRSVGANGQTHSQQYDLNDNPTTDTNPRQFSRTRAYDALDRLVSSTDALNGVTTQAYDAQDNLTQVVDPRGVTTRYEYDGLGNLTQLISPDTGTTTFQHDAAGNVIQKTDARGVVTTYRYDALNRLLARQYPATPALNVQYHYDMTANGNKGVGRLTAVQDASGVLGYQYDERGNLIQQLRSVPVLGSDQYDTLGYAYDAANNLVRIDYPAGFSIHYSRNTAGQVSQVGFAVGNATPTPLASQIAYAPFGPLKSLTWNNGIVLNRTYDQDYQLTAQQVGTWQSQYSHDANGNITAHAHSLFGSLDYQYDALDRLTEEKTADSRKAYAYDATGNRTSRTTYATTNGSEAQTAKQSLRYAPDSNRLAQRSSSYAVEADAAGHYTRYSQSRRYTYDDQGRLSAVTDAVDPLSTRAVRYTYNALGQRVLKEVQQGTARTPYTYLYGPDGQVMGQVRYTTAGRKSQASYYVWLDSLPIAQIDLTYSAGTTVTSTTLTYLHSDHLNTPRLATNQGGNLVWSWPSDAFGVGQPNNHGSTIDVILRFPGQVADAHSGLYYNYFRDYDPETGRYVESDPIGLRGGLNTYGYVMGNPLRYIDPTGESIAIVEALVVGAVIVGGVMIINSLGNPAGQDSQGGDNYGVIPDWHNPDYTGPIAPEAPSEMAKGGKQNIDNEYVRDVLAQGKNCNPCEYLRNLYQNERNAVERQKIKQAMKRFNCDGKNRFQ
ncbi:RHS repeat protein [Pseudomonas otitidis]|uniref:RHS repeat protein n=1 Tax=Metapseudomonas otitidis TaxID=319939 RepID=A0A7X3H404_9GAMM|nr:RHS repeat protein [Pseudomonas otitidis]MWK54775.1 RHS repeat protein [Pseudomonas otitidis]